MTEQMPLKISNKDFITAVFGESAPWCHVTDFAYDPTNIPSHDPLIHLIAWKGDYFSRYQMSVNTNQYFTISTFYCDNEQKARRRKSLFKSTHCIVLDDVKEKLSMSEVQKLPSPSWVLETSAGSEQWGYILDHPCEDRARVENLLDGLVANGLAPDGKDPGMRGVTRYVRLPEGVNNKASKLVNGLPFRCNMLVWQPFNRVSLEQLAEPFFVDLDRVRREARVDGAADVSDHPLINLPDILQIKEVRSDGRFDIQCPWVHEHTGADDSGSAVFTNADGSIGFKCHHGACQNRTGADLLRYIESKSAGFTRQLKNWQVMREFSNAAPISFLSSGPVEQPQTAPVTCDERASEGGAVDFRGPSAVAGVSFLDPAPSTPLQGSANQSTPRVSTTNGGNGTNPQTDDHRPEENPPDAIEGLCDVLRGQLPGTSEQRDLASKILKLVDDLPKIDQKHWHDHVMDTMRWSKVDFKEILTDLRKTWYGERISEADFYDTILYVKELNQFYDFKSNLFLSVEAFQNAYCHIDNEARKIALQDGRVQKVDKLDYAPKQPRIFIENGCVCGNTWSDDTQSKGVPGDHGRWVDHFGALGWEEHREHVEKWMAYTLRHPERKINHMLILGGGEGCGKDFLLYPLAKAMGRNYDVICGEQLLEGFNDYLLSTKYLHVNEAELGDRREAMAVSNKLKPLAAAPPEQLSVNQKSIKRIKVRNIINATMATNSSLPVRLNGPSRRMYAMWTDLNIRDTNGDYKPEWVEYWNDRWAWMKNGGWESVIWYLMNVVDLSDFNPDQAPKVTEFLRDIQEASKSPMQQTLEAFIEKRHGAFQCDVLTARDMSDTLRAGVMMPADMMTEPKFFTDKKVGMLLKDIGTFSQVRGGNARMWIIRNQEKYIHMSSTELFREYQRQINEARAMTQLKIVN